MGRAAAISRRCRRRARRRGLANERAGLLQLPGSLAHVAIDQPSGRGGPVTTIGARNTDRSAAASCLGQEKPADRDDQG